MLLLLRGAALNAENQFQKSASDFAEGHTQSPPRRAACLTVLELYDAFGGDAGVAEFGLMAASAVDKEIPAVHSFLM